MSSLDPLPRVFPQNGSSAPAPQTKVEENSFEKLWNQFKGMFIKTAKPTDLSIHVIKPAPIIHQPVRDQVQVIMNDKFALDALEMMKKNPEGSLNQLLLYKKMVTESKKKLKVMY